MKVFVDCNSITPTYDGPSVNEQIKNFLFSQRLPYFFWGGGGEAGGEFLFIFSPLFCGRENKKLYFHSCFLRERNIYIYIYIYSLEFIERKENKKNFIFTPVFWEERK